MLVKLNLKNFRKVEDSEMTFTSGLNVLRGSNEASKTTRIEAMLYALYGSKVLRNSLDECVTWGKPVGSLKVEAQFNLHGESYVFKRSKGGAEVYKGGALEPFVTGQTEVSNFATQLLGVDATTASKLMLASQGNLRGALELGPKATAEMVEDLADFSFFETLLDNMQQKLVLGSDVSASSRLAQARETLANLEAPEVDFEGLERRIEGRKALIAEHTDTLIPEARKRVSETNLALSVMRSKNEHRKTVKEELETRQAKLVSVQKTLAQAQQEVVPEVPLEAELSKLEHERKLAGDFKEVLAVYEAFTKLPVYTGSTWEGDEESLREEIEVFEQRKTTYNASIAEQKHHIRETKTHIIESTECNYCGQPIKNHAEVMKNNELLKAQLIQQEVKLVETEAKAKANMQDLQLHLAVLKADAPYRQFLNNPKTAKYGRIVADASVIPTKITWEGEVPNHLAAQTHELDCEIEKVQGKLNASRKAKTRIDVYNEQIDELEKEVAATQIKLDALPPFQVLNDLVKSHEEAEEILGNWEAQLNTFTHQQREDEQAIEVGKVRIQEYTERKAQQEANITSLEQELKDIGFNNALLKKVKEARPIISNQLWGLVLTSVSTMFSKMRGENSQVTKDKSGFKVNGQAVTSLSGSTLDLLGLSIRCSLIKLFIPNCPFLILDEPAAAMDSARTSQMMGFIRASDFGQVILITHEDMSELLADNVIEI